MIALDLFAGTGWGVACQRLGIEEYGVEIMPEAVATREANGMHTIYRDVWEGLDQDDYALDDYDLLIASPPCQTFSMAGGGKGREALDEVVGLIDARAYLDVGALRRFGERHDPRTALVLTPLAHVARDTPLYVVFEQVPPVLPVWERCAEEMRKWGYSVWTGIVNAEQYGVPQTRRRAILIARADGIEAAPPTPTHSRYYSRDPKRLDEGVKPWVSMAEALGWGMTEWPFVTAGNAVGRAEGIGGSGGKAAIVNAKERGAWAQVRLGQGEGRTERHGPRGGRPVEDPAYTVLGGEGGNSQPGFGVAMRSNFSAGGPPGATAEERGRTMREADQPSVTMSGKPGHWVEFRPATTVAGDSHVWPPGHKVNAADRARRDDADERYGNRAGTHAERVSVEEAAALQSYPPGFQWCGTKTKQFLQIGNAVPPLLAEAILKGFLA